MQAEIPTTRTPRQTTAREFLAILFRRRALILGLFVVTTLTVALLGATAPVDFVSSGRVLVKRGEKISTLSPDRRLYSDWEEDMGSEVEVVKSTPVLDRARAILHDEAGPGHPAPAIQSGNVDVEVKGRTNVVLLGYIDRDPIVARQVCDALLRAYVDFRQSNYELTESRSFFEGEMEKVQKELDHWVVLRRDYAERANVIDLPVQRNADIARMSSIQQRLSENDADLAEATATLKQMTRFSEADHLDQPTFHNVFGEETGLSELKRRLVEQEFKVASLRENLRDDAPEVVAAAGTLDTLRTMIRREIASRVEGARARVEMLQVRHDVMQKEIDVISQGMAAMPQKELSIGEMDHRIELLKAQYKELSDNSDKARINERTSPGDNVVLLDHASDARPNRSHDYVRLALGPAFSVIVGIGLAFFIDGLDLTVRTANHAEEAVELPVLATLVERRRSRRRHPLEPERAAS